MDAPFVENLNTLKGRESASSFAKHCGIKPGTMINYLAGNTDPKLGALRKICKASNASIGWLLGDPVAHSAGHSVTGGSGIIQAGTVIGSSVKMGNQEPIELTEIELALIEKLRRVGSPIMIDKIMNQLQRLEDFVKEG